MSVKEREREDVNKYMGVFDVALHSMGMLHKVMGEYYKANLFSVFIFSHSYKCKHTESLHILLIIIVNAA